MKDRINYLISLVGSICSIISVVSYFIWRSNDFGVDFLQMLRSPYFMGIFLFFGLWGLSSLIVTIRQAYFIPDEFKIISSEYTLIPKNPDANLVEITRVRYIKPLVKNLGYMYEGTTMTDGKVVGMHGVIAEVDRAEEDSDGRNKANLIIPGVQSLGKPSRHMTDADFICDPPLQKGKLYRHTATWEIEGGYSEEREFFILSVGYSTGKAQFRIVCPDGRRIDRDSASALQVASAGSIVRTSCRNDALHVASDGKMLIWAIRKPSKGDKYKIAWRWFRV
jgi:hypothetical protein